MNQGRVRSILALVLAGTSLAWASSARAEGNTVQPPTIPPGTEIEFFEKKVRPVLVDHCYKCHSVGEGAKIKANLRLDTKEGLLKGGDSGPAIVPGNPEKSLLIKAIHYKDDDLQMPPKEPLTAQQVADLVAWVKAGAQDPRVEGAKAVVVPAYDFEQWKQFWSFRPVQDPPVPTPAQQEWARSPIDKFVMAEWEKRGLKPSGPADKRTLIRRATFDLTGLPPTVEEVEAFLNDQSPNAFEKVVDRLLASPAYGERWGRHWLDLVRYADTSGCNSDYPIPSAFRYRNYVIDSFNRDKPYTTFLQEQLAGDLMPHDSVEHRNEHVIATGYLAIARRFGSRASEVHQTIEDLIENTGKTMLGLSVNCSRCHDHKFDPIPQSDYYALYGIFNSAVYAFPGTEIYKTPKDFVPLGTPEEVATLREHEARLSELDDRIEFLVKESRNALRGPKPEAEQAKAEQAKADGAKADATKDGEVTQDEAKKDQAKPAETKPDADKDAEKAAEKPKPVAKPAPRPADAPPLGELPRSAPPTKRHIDEVNADLREARAEQKRLAAKPPAIQKAYAVQEGLFKNARIHRKGEPRNLGDEVPRRFLTILGAQELSPGEATITSGRLQLAQWITDPANPLTARVMVNRIWQHHFGKGLVQTPNDFGSRGKKPTHPELLDYLATRFVQGGYSVKAMHRTLMLSRVYQMASENGQEEANALLDANNDYLWRFSRRRLSAEEIRDAMLAVSGALDAGVMTVPHPFPPENEWRYTQHTPFVGDYNHYDHRKRSVYLMQQRIKKHPFLEVFDGADTNASTDNRSISTTAVQALFVMNNPLAHELADKLAERLAQARGDDAARLRYACEMTLGRPASEEDVRMGLAYLEEMQAKVAAAGVAKDQQPRAALASYCRMLFGSNEFFFVD